MVIAGAPTVQDNYLQYAANVAAEFMDPNGTGRPTISDSIRRSFGGKENNWMLGLGTNEQNEKKICDGIQGGWTCYSFQAWHFIPDLAEGRLNAEQYSANVKRVINEEIFHLYTHALAKVVPT